MAMRLVLKDGTCKRIGRKVRDKTASAAAKDRRMQAILDKGKTNNPRNRG